LLRTQGCRSAFILLLLILTLTACAQERSFQTRIATSPDSPQPDVQRPIIEVNPNTPEQAYGIYWDGKLTHPSQLPLDGTGFLKIMRLRNRAYATDILTKVIAAVGKNMIAKFPSSERLQVADIAQFGGGQVGGHRSHQNGLDADIVYLRKNLQEQEPHVNGFQESFVKNGKITANFDVARNWHLMNELVATKRVGRIFVDAAIKKAFCSYITQLGVTPERTETLRRMGLVSLHDDHLHLRLKCPSTSTHCKLQVEPSTGSGCDLKSLVNDTEGEIE